MKKTMMRGMMEGTEQSSPSIRHKTLMTLMKPVTKNKTTIPASTSLQLNQNKYIRPQKLNKNKVVGLEAILMIVRMMIIIQIKMRVEKKISILLAKTTLAKGFSPKMMMLSLMTLGD